MSIMGKPLIFGEDVIGLAAGKEIRYEDGAGGIPLRKAMSGFHFTQQGSGDPSPDNVRPIIGVSNCTITRTGKNLCSGLINGYYSESSGGLFPSSNWVCTESKIPCKPGLTYTVSWMSGYTTRKQGFIWYDADYNMLGRNYWAEDATNGKTGTAPENAAFFVYSIAGTTTHANITPSSLGNFQIELGATATTIIPFFEGQTYNISWLDSAGVAYAGTVDVVNGILKKTFIIVDLGNLTWSKSGTRIFSSSYSNTIAIPSGNSVPTTGVADSFKTATYIDIFNNNVDLAIGVSTSPNAGVITIRDRGSGSMTATQYKSYLSGRMFCFPLKNPTTTTIDTTKIIQANRNNTILSNRGTIEIEYVKNSLRYIS